MPNENKLKAVLRKGIKFFLYTFLGIFILVNLLIILSGKFYIYEGISNTYLKGRTGPSIYDKETFFNNTIEKSDSVYKWTESDYFNTQAIPKEYLSYMEGQKTKALLVFKGDEILFEKYWDEHNSETVSNSFSVAKTIVALLVGAALDDGKIKSIDEPVGNYIPEFNAGEKKKITIRHLLMMSSGLDWFESGKNPLSDNAESYYGDDLYGLVTRQHVLKEPGQQFLYQSGNSQLLGYVIENATGENLSAYTQQKIWNQIGMEHTAYWSLDKEEGDEKAFCCMYASARDYGRLGKLILNKGKWGNKTVISESYMNEMFRNGEMTTEEGVPNYRYGLHIWTYYGAANPVFYCRGILGQYIITIPEEDLLIVRLGEERENLFKIEEQHKGDEAYLKKFIYNIGHPHDLFKYITLGKIIEVQSKK